MPRLLLTLLAALALLCGVAYAVQAVRGSGATGPAGFRLSVLPSRQTAIGGQAIRYSVTVKRSARFRGSVALGVFGLPRGARAAWELADGTRGGAVPPADDGATLTILTSPRTPTGRWRLTIRGRGGGHSRVRTLTMTVRRRHSRYFTVVAAPTHQHAGPGDTAAVGVRVVRARGFRRAVRLSVLRLPSRSAASWAPARLVRAREAGATLNVRLPGDSRTASSRLVIFGNSRIRGRIVHRYTVVWLTVAAPGRVSIAGDLGPRLGPGRRAPLDLTLTNHQGAALRVSRLSVAMRAATSRAACDARANYALTQYSGPYPLVLAPGATRLSTLVPDPARWPQVEMVDRAENQDACQGARLALDYTGTAIR